MPRNHQALPAQTVIQLLAMYGAGQKYEVIEMALKVSTTTIWRYARQYNVQHPNAQRGGHPR